MGKVVIAIGVGVAVVFALISILNIGLYGGAMDLDYGNCQGPCRERTGAIGIVAGVLGFVLSLVVIAGLLLPLFVPSTAEPMPSLVLKLLLLICLFVVIVFYITAWALMAKDIDDFLTYATGCSTSPDVWNAALAFGLFGFLIGIALFLVLVIALVVDRNGGEGGGGGGGADPSKGDYA